MVPIFNDANQRVGALLSGGLDDNNVSAQTWLFDAVLLSWKRLADMPTPRTRHAAALLGGKLYVMGGFDSSVSFFLGGGGKGGEGGMGWYACVAVCIVCVCVCVCVCVYSSIIH